MNIYDNERIECNSLFAYRQDNRIFRFQFELIRTRDLSK